MYKQNFPVVASRGGANLSAVYSGGSGSHNKSRGPVKSKKKRFCKQIKNKNRHIRPIETSPDQLAH